MADLFSEGNIYKKAPLGIAPDGRSYSAVIVDDSATIRQLLKRILLSISFNVIAEFDNGALAVNKIKSRDVYPDYMFVDLEMPILNGIGVVREVRPILPFCKIFMVTSNSEKDKVQELVKLGIDGYIKKPFDRDTLIKRISGDIFND